ncbi:MAG: hypothetical protein QNJ46_15515 [Leptolyngbyaceae cyanobacterium MO_188.B28]|nr:hypothetical protein [Leptolyngbyaceae cyanobacterium MO_188.B28]
MSERVSYGRAETCGVESFNVWTRKDYAEVQALCPLPEALYPDLLRFGANYSPSGLVVMTVAEGGRTVIYQAANVIDLEGVYGQLSLAEEGWTLEDGVLCSPENTAIATKKIRALLEEAAHESKSEQAMTALEAA